MAGLKIVATQALSKSFWQRIIFISLLLTTLPCLALDKAKDLSDFRKRQIYTESLDNLKRGATTEFNKNKKKLKGYVLEPYLEYHRLNGKLNNAGPKELETFLGTHSDLAVSPILKTRWLKKQGAKRKWKDFLSIFKEQDFLRSSNAELKCYYLRSLYGTGRKKEALKKTTELWLSPKSQPKSCDPLFDVWRSSQHFNQDIAWQRLEKAIKANQRTLSKYLLRFFSGAYKTRANAYYLVHTQPRRILQTRNFTADTEKNRTVIEHGLVRLSTRDPKKTLKAWKKYRTTHDFSELQKKVMTERLSVAIAKTGAFPEEAKRSEITSAFAVIGLANAAIAVANWQELNFWANKLPEEEKSTHKWRFWRALSKEKIMDSDLRSNPHDHEDDFLKLAQERNYYGFLAAERLAIPSSLNAETDLAYSGKIIAKNIHAKRALELFAVGEELNARREWFRAFDEIEDQHEKRVLAHAVKNIGKISLAIFSANLADATDDLTLRFPNQYGPQFDRASHKGGISPSLLKAITRQESAYDPKAKSSAGARGLMQLMPRTARLVARRMNVKLAGDDSLYEPLMNIQLGSFHIAWLLERYKGNRPQAIAAYNAGESRVDRWLKERDGLPIENWIETIPFKETRNYVKNVLAFTQVYERLAGNSRSSILNPGERIIGG